MENRNVGYLLIGMSSLIVLIIFMYKKALTSFVDSSCTLAHGGNYCPMYDTISQQTYLALGIVSVLIIVGLVLVFSKPSEKIIVRKIKEKLKKKEIDTSNLTKEEKQILNIIQINGTIFQADLIEKTNMSKAKITRILDKLENKEIIERKRRGLTNIVVIK
jgi:predicted HTH transcriptional regulator